MRYRFVRDQAHRYPVVILCHVLKVARSGYYAWRDRPTSRRHRENDRLLQLIRDVFAGSRETYGSPRVHAQLRGQGERCGKHRVARLMRRQGLIAKQRRRYRATTDSRHDLPVAPNRLDRDFGQGPLNRVWVSDITYVPTAQGWLYVATVMDLGSRRIVGWAMSARIDTALVCEALQAALAQRQPAPGLLHHSDRGSQYASAAYQALLARHGLVCSMSRKGNCWDNAPMESFFHSLKVEELARRTFETRAAARQAVFTYIEVWYNRQRLHSTLGYRSPEQYERLLAA